MNLTDKEQAFIRAARELDDPQVIESDRESLTAAADDFDDATVMEKADYVEAGEQLKAVRDGLESGIIEHGALCDTTVEQLDFDALWRAAADIGPSAEKSKFETLTLTQEPEAGGTGVDDGGESLSGDREEIESLLSRARHMTVAAPERATELREKAESLAGVESYEEIEVL